MHHSLLSLRIPHSAGIGTAAPKYAGPVAGFHWARPSTALDKRLILYLIISVKIAHDCYAVKE